MTDCRQYADLKPGVRALCIDPESNCRWHVGLVRIGPTSGLFGLKREESKEGIGCELLCDCGGEGWEYAKYLISLKGDPDAARKRSYRRTVKA